MVFDLGLRVCTFALLSVGLSTTFAVTQDRGRVHDKRQRDEDDNLGRDCGDRRRDDAQR